MSRTYVMKMFYVVCALEPFVTVAPIFKACFGCKTSLWWWMKVHVLNCTSFAQPSSLRSIIRDFMIKEKHSLLLVFILQLDKNVPSSCVHSTGTLLLHSLINFISKWFFPNTLFRFCKLLDLRHLA